ncbi:flavin monoamine oxidase family protein [Halomonas heilongjiangensis]|uniref:Amine oxidoreductase n=1 Tax=Halomonas heilongjiangensis TaxID=1387883 RepID=A0A2N7TQF4_9GAMM|nr:FAD-dependent oxidoreductase [Halomonas heilongjiangensis]PMR70431.1 amine oxidoreductase [Halomonas heilongjiangensis]PXX91392.1 amine oxidoreductase [Halomonas heilongjiangensis]
MAHYTLKDLHHGNPLPKHTDTLVVGAGMAGLYTAWRIIEDKPDANVTIIEKSGRTGGRLNSDVVKIGEDRVKEEEGGMRFTFDEMDNLMSLLMMLKIDDQIVPFPMNSGGNNRLLFRNKSFNNTQAAANNFAIWSELYKLQPTEKGKSPNAIINGVFNCILDNNPQFTERPEKRGPEFWQKFRLECQWKGIKMKDWTLWNLFSAMGHSDECIDMLYRAAGFNGTFLSSMNAGVAFQLLEEFPADPGFRTLENGFSTLPNALVDRICKEHKERIHLKTQLLSIHEAEPGKRKGYRVKYQTMDEHHRVHYGELTAEKVVLGLPRLALEKLFIGSNLLNDLKPEDSEKLWNTLQTTTNQPLLKINLYYDKAWWGNGKTSSRAKVAFGPNFSDSPLGSVYPFYAIDEASLAALEYEEWLKTSGTTPSPDVQEKLDNIVQSKYDRPAALTIYCDYLNINFWETLQNQGELFDSPLQRECTKHDPQTLFAASKAVVERATHYFKALFDTQDVPQPILTSARIWDGTTRFNVTASQEFGFGVHQWAVGADDQEVMAYLCEPIENIYVCGEAFSDYQGWVEGALRSANRVLKKGFDLAPISEVFKKKHLRLPSSAIKESYQQSVTKMIREYIDPDFVPGGSEDSEYHEPVLDAESLVGAINLSYFDKP